MKANELKKDDILYRYAVNMQEDGVMKYRFDVYDFEYWLDYGKKQARVWHNNKLEDRMLKNIDCGIAQVVNKVAFIWMTKRDADRVKQILKCHYIDKLYACSKELSHTCDILDLIEEGMNDGSAT